MILNSVLVGIGGFFGAVARFKMSKWLNGHFNSDFPYDTLAVNLIGSFSLGLIVGLDWKSSWELLVGTGFMGAFTTFSTFNAENVQLYFNKEWKILFTYLFTSYSVGILLAFFGMFLGTH